MDSRSFDRFARSVASPKSRRGFLGGIAALGASYLGARHTSAQATQVDCGNQTCAKNPYGCNPDCVCCIYTNPITGKVINSRCRPPGTCAPGYEFQSCFTGDTLVAMADGTTKPIARVEVGDRVMGQTGINRVEAIERPRLGSRRLYSLNGGAFFVTSEHPFLTEAGWKAIDPAATAAENPSLTVGRLTVGDRMLALAGVAVPALAGGYPALEPRFEAVALGSLIGMPADPATPLYNLRLDGDHTYIANDLIVHNK